MVSLDMVAMDLLVFLEVYLRKKGLLLVKVQNKKRGEKDNGTTRGRNVKEKTKKKG